MHVVGVAPDRDRFVAMTLGDRELLRCARLLLLLIALLLGWGCGSKTSLGVEGLADSGRPPFDSGPSPVDTGPPPRPDCFGELAPGDVRGQLEGIDGRPAYDALGNLYAPQQTEEGWRLVSHDPCLALRWAVDLPEAFDGRPWSIRTSVDVHVSGHVWLKGRFEVTRVTTDGVLDPPSLDVEGQVWTWVAIPAAGPVYGSTNGTDMPKYLYRTRAGGGSDRVVLEEPSSFLWNDECLVDAGGRGAVLCWNVAYELTSLTRRYYRNPPALIDGTLRNITQPAFDGARLWSLRYGISTYELIGLDARSGEMAVRQSVARTTSGQTNAIMGPPVIGPRGEVLVYFNGSRATGADGQLHAFSGDDGDPLWSYPAPRIRGSGTGRVFSVTSNLAVGDAGVVYLAVGESLHGVAVVGGERRWATSGLGDVNDPELQISPLGDIAVRTGETTVTIVATESRGVGPTPWPVAGGGPSATYAE
ncbi:MAG: hypothetical protein DRJ42_02100 [Deltaproteobacteria bacterium]|nr:MAG: hypothetical protein DRJ42_02100 [Deltaproteobacteria bacterium]